MIRVHVFVEGQTEETFVRDVLAEELQNAEIYLNPIVIKTSRTGKGGVVSYEVIKKQIQRKCKEDRSAFVTTMFDFYRLPKTFPGISSIPEGGDPYQKSEYLEQALEQDIDQTNFLAYLMMYEFEGLLYSWPEAFHDWFGESVVEQLKRDRDHL
ncbi:DUF4276 family protein [Spirulina sp. CS-785/01]|uniref:DUF4276 family protein n=1 Tax=Spirulina sp. CS-785/01 TaxID=3021716 RepID=UPI00232F9376|nr:DUF4276 family protein [Spirulina sp. CS-785/01]MDB9315259.1 DUF4276 family protein [Spirulina sp. CS-785/01]